MVPGIIANNNVKGKRLIYFPVKLTSINRSIRGSFTPVTFPVLIKSITRSIRGSSDPSIFPVKLLRKIP